MLSPLAPQSRKKRGNARKTPEIVRFRGLEAMMSFPASRYGRGVGFFIARSKTLSPLFANSLLTPLPVFSLVALPFFVTGGGRAQSPLPLPPGRSGPPVPTDKKKKDANASFFLTRRTEKDIAQTGTDFHTKEGKSLVSTFGSAEQKRPPSSLWRRP